MLQLKGITKDYVTAGYTVHALKGVDLRFRKNEFVSILGASGCGKTTLLNIVGGLDHYTDGDLIINGVSTKNYKDRDWDVYRNHRIGFVFQSYNLIPHQTILGNVELSLTIAGVSKSERRKRAEEALIKVGLKEEMYKRPNQLSGGQMQRVAIARALVNNPEILLADEPTGALDTTTSVQIMDLIKEIAGERLVIMVTHNPELAEKYSSRIVRLQDGLVLSDSNPYEGDEKVGEEEFEKPVAKKAKKKGEKASMSFKTSLGLSARNLLSKKGRTAITSFAGSIGIISVCLVLALSNGFNNYILKTQEDMLSYQPLEITETTVNMDAIMAGMMSATDMPDLKELDNKAYVNSFLTNIAQGMTVTNDLSQEYIDYLESMDESLYSAIVYDTGMDLLNNLYTEVEMKDPTKAPVYSISNLKAYYTDELSKLDEKYASLAQMVPMLGSVYGKLPGTTDMSKSGVGDYVLSQYDIIGESSRFPANYNEAVLVLGANNDITDLTLTQLGLLSEDKFLSLFPGLNKDDLQENKQEDVSYETVDFSKIIGKEYKLFSNDAIYTLKDTPDDSLFDYTGTKSNLQDGEGISVKIVGVLRLKEGRNYGCLNSGLCFTEELYAKYQQMNENTKLVETIKAQKNAFAKLVDITTALQEAEVGSEEYMEAATQMQKFMLTDVKYLKQASKNLSEYYRSPAEEDGEMSLPKDIYFLYGDSALRAVGGLSNPNSIKIYTDTFDAKEGILEHLDKWNTDHASEELKGKQVKYTDTVGMMMTMVQSILNAITYVLVAFTAISLVVSSVMIGIITYVSVVERTKEIGVLRSLGARKMDIKNLFNAETFIIGLTSGLFGVGVTYLLSLGINALLGALTGIATLASLPITSAAIMVVISVCLTLISGLIPAQAAAKKDPVVALRTE